MNDTATTTSRPGPVKPDFLSLREENRRLKEDNARLRSENEQLRSIFDIAADRFHKLEKQVEQLKRELAEERSYRKELEIENRQLKKEPDLLGALLEKMVSF